MCDRYHIKFIDLYSSLAAENTLDKKYDAGDHLHLNANGYVKWTELVKPYLK